ncbi:MAG TPA: sugar diacid recognition domain-containing protein [Candidatus Sulfotelmatobacter sp.]|jgi:carbohydrate diacid regulator|nr:sugar diacid recognition domain-containing protein [Candidatus Sulfotelmatobacter sp.]
MQKLDPALAQSIVSKSMSIIDCNVNIMDIRGVIIASGDQGRIGQVHEGALLVLSHQRAVEIDGEMCRQFHGSKPGINLPLRAEGEIVGCLGLTGNPEELRQPAELLRMAAETMLERETVLRMVARDEHLHEQLTLGLVQTGTAAPALANWAEAQGIDLALPRVATVIELDGGDMDADAVSAEIPRLYPVLKDADHKNLVATVSRCQVTVLHPALNRKGEWDLEAQRLRAEKLLPPLRDACSVGLKLALGHYFPEAGGLMRSFQVARSTLAIGKLRAPQTSAYFYADIKLPVLLDALRGQWQGRELLAPLERLIRHDRQGQLLKTLVRWFACGMQMAATANALEIHRNTLDYRMGRIAEISGLDLSSTEDRVRLYLALQMVDAKLLASCA